MTCSAAKVHKVPHESLHVSKPTWWLESRFHFSFADYWDPKRSNFGALRVVNDDLVKGKAGFGRHPHRDMEIFSYVIDGQLSHQDSMGNKEALGRGSVQYMSAGTGVTHSEMNDGEETCRFLQIWIQPDKRGYAPQYGSSTYKKEDRQNRLLHILGGTGSVPSWPSINSINSIKLNQDANVFVSELEANQSLELPLKPNRQAYLVTVEGGLDVNGTSLDMRDAAKIVGSPTSSTELIVKSGAKGGHFLMIEMTAAE
jgi:redox-sensitive bicupin YhaK (pirin superfamily)